MHTGIRVYGYGGASADSRVVTWPSSFKEPTYAKKHAVAVANIYTSGGVNSDENT